MDGLWLHLYVMLSRATTAENLPVIRDPGSDFLSRGPPADLAAREAMLNASFEALAAFCTTQEGVDRVMKAEGLDFVIEHLREEVDGASTAQLSKAVNLLQSITQHGSPALSSHITTLATGLDPTTGA